MLSGYHDTQKVPAAIISNSNNHHHHEVNNQGNNCLRQMRSYFKHQIIFVNYVLGICYIERQLWEVKTLELTNRIRVGKCTTQQEQDNEHVI